MRIMYYGRKKGEKETTYVFSNAKKEDATTSVALSRNNIPFGTSSNNNCITGD